MNKEKLITILLWVALVLTSIITLYFFFEVIYLNVTGDYYLL